MYRKSILDYVVGSGGPTPLDGGPKDLNGRDSCSRIHKDIMSKDTYDCIAVTFTTTKGLKVKDKKMPINLLSLKEQYDLMEKYLQKIFGNIPYVFVLDWTEKTTLLHVHGMVYNKHLNYTVPLIQTIKTIGGKYFAKVMDVRTAFNNDNWIAYINDKRMYRPIVNAP